ncbi:hypothetical protein V5O48_019048, partial [Marasmius crinis-equi]
DNANSDDSSEDDDSSDMEAISDFGVSAASVDVVTYVDVLDDLRRKLDFLSIRLRNPVPHSVQISASIHTCFTAVDQLLNVLPTETLVLPRRQHVAPNQHSWTETAQVMGCAVKTKKRKLGEGHDRSYSAGEKSGKLAKADARVPLSQAHGQSQFTATPTQTSTSPSQIPALPAPPPTQKSNTSIST